MKKIKEQKKKIIFIISLILFILSIVLKNNILSLISLLFLSLFLLNKDKINIITFILLLLNNNYIDSYIFLFIYLLFINNFSKLNLNFIYSDYVRVKHNKRVNNKKIDNVKINDILLISKDETILVDGIIIKGSGKVYNCNKNKENKLKVNDLVEAGFINKEKELLIKVTKEYKDTLFYKKFNYINNIRKQECDFLNKFNLIINIISILFLIFYLIIYIFTNNIYIILLYFILLIKLFEKIIYLILDKKIIDMFNENIYFKNKNIFLKLNKIKNIFFSKSGVITTGNYRITKIKTSNEDEFLKYLNLGEYNLNNEIGKIIKNYKEIDISNDIKKVKNYKFINSRGCTYKYEKNNIIIGNEYYIKEQNIDLDFIKDVGTIIYVIVNKQLLGYIVISDSIKKSVKKNLNKLSKLGINKTCLLSGDNTRIVSGVSKEVGIKDYYSNSNIYEKGFWYIYFKKLNKGKNMYVRNRYFDNETIISDINVCFSNELVDFDKSDIIVLPDLYNIVRLIKYVKDFYNDFIKNIILLIIFMLINIGLLFLNINYISIYLVINILMFILIYYNNYKK